MHLCIMAVITALMAVITLTSGWLNTFHVLVFRLLLKTIVRILNISTNKIIQSKFRESPEKRCPD